MAKNYQRLRRIYDKTDGCCHICHKSLRFNNHGVNGASGAWHVEHSIPKSQGGTDHLNNLYPACIACNLQKGTSHTSTARYQHGVKRAPHSAARKAAMRKSNATGGALFGAVVGALAGPVGVVVGAAIGGMIGSEATPKT